MFGLFKKDKKEKSTPNNTVDISKKKEVLSLRKDKFVVSLEKKNAQGITARVVAVMDKSGSMQSLYNKGVVQETMERLFPVALEFDDDGELESYLFDNSFTELEPVTMNNFHNYQQQEMDSHGWGGTNYAPVMKDIVKKYKDYTDFPTYVIFITDGDNFDKSETTQVIKDASNYPIFWQFIGIGTAGMSYLEKLDDMDGRAVDNADFFRISNIESYSDEDLYNNLLNEFPGWVTTVTQKGYLG